MRLPPWIHRVTAVILVTGLGLGLAALLYRRGRVLGFDSYYYCELAKLYTHSWPPAFGNGWPCGYPLLGGLIGRLGLPAYEALCVVSAAGMAALVALALRWVGGGLGLWTALALVALPEMGVQVFGVMTELPFAAALLGVAAGLAAWPARSGFWAAAVCAVLALALRYAGIVAFGVIWIWLWDRRKMLHAAGALRPALTAAAGATLAAIALLGWNQLATGHLSGMGRTPPEGTPGVALVRNLADFGWSLPSALMLGGLRARIGAASPASFAVGWALMLSWLLLCVWGWGRPQRPWARVLGLMAFAYLAGMLVLRTVASFDPLAHPRMFLPAAFPLGLLLVAQCPTRARWALVPACAVLIACGVLSSARGLSREVGGDIGPAVPLLRARLEPGDVIQLNEHAFSLAAYVREPTEKVDLGYGTEHGPGARFLVLAARPMDRAGTPGTLAPGWRDWSKQWVRRGSHRWLLRTPALEVLERTDHPAAGP